jgi:hypothetical protein
MRPSIFKTKSVMVRLTRFLAVGHRFSVKSGGRIGRRKFGKGNKVDIVGDKQPPIERFHGNRKRGM